METGQHPPHDGAQRVSAIRQGSHVPSSGFDRVIVAHDEALGVAEDTAAASRMIHQALELRTKYMGPAPHGKRADIPPATDEAPTLPFEVKSHEGIVYALDPAQKEQDEAAPHGLHTWSEFREDYMTICNLSVSGPLKSFAYERLKMLEHLWGLHNGLNEGREAAGTSMDEKDFSSVPKVDTHIHLAAAMTSKQLFDFIKRKVGENGDDVVSHDDKGKPITLASMFDSANIDVDQLSIHSLDVRADNAFNRFDNFNAHYNPFGMADLRSIFLKSSNVLKGRYFAELTRSLLDKHEQHKYIYTEYRVSIYGRKPTEWSALADWILDHDLTSTHNRWMVQVPRIYDVWKKTKSVKDFGQVLSNIFQPVMEVLVDPSVNPKLFQALRYITGFDSVDDESKHEVPLPRGDQKPSEWNGTENPSYAYWCYYMWANIMSLNRLRRLRQLPDWTFRPHCGESGSELHLAAAFLSAHHINHGIQLQQNMPLQYLYYLTQIGLAVSPLSNNSLFLDYKRNPFPLFFMRGLNVSLSTDDPLQFHMTQSPLIEEYAIAHQRWGLSQTDMSEIARNSVLQSGFEHSAVLNMLGPTYWRHDDDAMGNDVNWTNVPSMRIIYRTQTLRQERDNIDRWSGAKRLLSRRFDTAVSRATFERGLEAQYTRIILRHSEFGDLTSSFIANDERQAAQALADALALRSKYLYTNPTRANQATTGTSVLRPSREELADTSDRAPTQHVVHMNDGVLTVYPSKAELCSNDEESLALWACSECDARYCTDCDAVFHRNPAKRSHKRLPLRNHHPCYETIGMAEFSDDVQTISKVTKMGPVKSYSLRRLGLLESKFEVHKLLNMKMEEESMRFNGRDPYQLITVDTHCHLASSMVATHLLEFLIRTVKEHGDDVVMYSPTHKPVTLREVYDEQGVPLDKLSLDSLGVTADDTFRRFDRFNAKYKILGSSTLRSLFLKRNNLQKGKYYAELIKEVMQRAPANIRHEFRVSIYGADPNEWDALSDWVKDNEIPHVTNRWVVQVPRVYDVHVAKGRITSFADLLRNVFEPLFRVTIDPSSNPKLHRFLLTVSGFDSVDDESMGTEVADLSALPPPEKWDSKKGPPYAYWLYYMWANIVQLNNLREEVGLPTFELRPHAGTGGTLQHLGSAFLLADGITHGLALDQCPPLQYLYYLAQIGISTSPLAENSLYVKYTNSPFVQFYKRGLRVTLSSDNPLQLHMTTEPLMEEIAIATQMWKLSNTDISEIIRNSVLMSGWPCESKQEWISKQYFLDPMEVVRVYNRWSEAEQLLWMRSGDDGASGPLEVSHDVRASNDPRKTNVSNIRVDFRVDSLKKEYLHLHHVKSSGVVHRVRGDSVVDNAELQARQAAHAAGRRPTRGSPRDRLRTQLKGDVPILQMEECD